MTLDQVLRRHAESQPDRLAYQFLENGTELGASLSFAQLERRAQALAVRLQRELVPGDRTILLYPAGLDFLEAFLGALYAGVIPIPAPTPDAVQFKRAWPRLQAIIQDAAVSLILTNVQFEPSLRDQLPAALGAAPRSAPESAPGSTLGDARIMVTDPVEEGLASQFQAQELALDDLAYLQYTSGSIAAPKGVMISHGNLMAQLQDLQAALDYSATSRSLNWMPHHHDYGLVQGLLLPLFAGARGYVMSPTSFIRKPMRWLEAISKFGITHSQGSNFAYAYCLRKFDRERTTDLDLSGWSAASIGAEPINPEVLQAFERTFMPFGFKAKALTPAFGLAEATLVVSTRRPGSGVRYGQFEARALAKGRVAETENQVQRTLVGCGLVVGEGTRLRIVNPESHRACGANEIGEIWVAGPSVATGYWNRPEESTESFGARVADSDEGPFLRTGDLGFVDDGELFIVGRHKDLIIIRGQNHYPQDIEFAVEASHPKLRAGRCAAFSVEAAVSEQLVVVVELTGSGDEAIYQAVVGAINEAVGQAAELTPHAIVLIRSGSLPVTSSGKIQRQACRRHYRERTLEVVYEHIHSNDDETLERKEALQQQPASRQPLVEQLLRTPESVDDEPLRAYLLSVLAEVLKTGDLNWLAPDQDLLELGIDSLASVEVRSYIEEELGLTLPINYLKLFATLAELSRYLKQQLSARSVQRREARRGQIPVAAAVVAAGSGAEGAEIRNHPADDQKEKQRLLDWQVKEQDSAYDLTREELQSWERLSLPPDKVRMRRRGPRIITDDWRPAEPFIQRETKVLGMGSCFTRDIVLWLAECGFNQRFPGSPYNALLRYPATGNNAYLSAQFRLLGNLSEAEAADRAEVDEACRFLDAEQDEGRSLYRLLQEMEVLLLTLGGVETWRDATSGSVLKAPLVLAEYSPERHQFGIDSYADTLQHLETIDAVARAHFPHLRIIFTLPLGRMSTYRPLNALNAASAQEATLRAALGEFLERRSDELGDRIHYFPAHELLTQFFVDPYQVDNVHATPFVTGRLCASFAEMFCSAPPQSPNSSALGDFDPFHTQAIAASLDQASGNLGDEELRTRIAALEAQNATLQSTCDERQDLILRLQTQTESLQSSCDERLAVIEKLDGALRAHRESTERSALTQASSILRQRIGRWLRKP